MNKIEKYAFRQGLRQVNEGGLNRIMAHGKYGFIIISANRSEIYSSNKDLDLTPEYMEWCNKEHVDPSEKTQMDFWLRQRNKQAESQLLDDLKKSIYSFTPVYGGYHGTDNVADSFEPSFIVYCHSKDDSKNYLNWNNLYNFALKLCKKYKQDSVYIQAPDEAPIYVNAKGEKANSRESKTLSLMIIHKRFLQQLKEKKEQKWIMITV